MKTIELIENQFTAVELSPLSFEYLASNFHAQLEIEITGTVGCYRLKPKHHVGTIVAPDLRIRIKPKCPTKSLFYMIGHAYQLAFLQKETIGQAEGQDLQEVLIAMFLAQLEEMLLRGLRRDYRLSQDELPLLRGRILMAKSWLSLAGHGHKLTCEYEDFSADVRDNRVLAFSLDLLLASKGLSSKIAARLKRARAQMIHVSCESFSSKQIAIFNYSRLNEHYQALHHMCRLIIDGIALNEESGQISTSAFLLDMNRLFEQFVTNWMKAAVRHPFSIRAQGSGFLDAGRHVRIIPDLILTKVGDDVLIADTKYKRTENERTSNADVFQVLAYCLARKVNVGFLIYPKWEADSRHIRVRDGAKLVIQDGIDLGVEPSAMDAQLVSLFSRIIDSLSVETP